MLISHMLMHDVPEFSVYNPGALFIKSLSNNIDFLNSAPGVVYEKLRYWSLHNVFAMNFGHLQLQNTE